MKEIRAEKKIIYATWGPTKGSSLYVAFKDDGSDRTGLAQYLCLILGDYKLHGIIVHVMTSEERSARSFRGTGAIFPVSGG
jgi:hypothetical protein